MGLVRRTQRVGTMSKAKGTVRVSSLIGAPSVDVWRELEQIEQHATWTLDAIAIRFLSEQCRGVGTAFECDTKVVHFDLPT
jgi:hypothetical protein